MVSNVGMKVWAKVFQTQGKQIKETSGIPLPVLYNYIENNN